MLRGDRHELPAVLGGDLELEAAQLGGFLGAAACERRAHLQGADGGEFGAEFFQTGNLAGHFARRRRGAGLEIVGEAPLPRQRHLGQPEARQRGGELFAAHRQIPYPAQDGPAGRVVDLGVEQRLDRGAADQRDPGDDALAGVGGGLFQFQIQFYAIRGQARAGHTGVGDHVDRVDAQVRRRAQFHLAVYLRACERSVLAGIGECDRPGQRAELAGRDPAALEFKRRTLAVGQEHLGVHLEAAEPNLARELDGIEDTGEGREGRGGRRRGRLGRRFACIDLNAAHDDLAHVNFLPGKIVGRRVSRGDFLHAHDRAVLHHAHIAQFGRGQPRRHVADFEAQSRLAAEDPPHRPRLHPGGEGEQDGKQDERRQAGDDKERDFQAFHDGRKGLNGRLVARRTPVTSPGSAGKKIRRRTNRPGEETRAFADAPPP